MEKGRIRESEGSLASKYDFNVSEFSNIRNQAGAGTGSAGTGSTRVVTHIDCLGVHTYRILLSLM